MGHLKWGKSLCDGGGVGVANTDTSSKFLVRSHPEEHVVSWLSQVLCAYECRQQCKLQKWKLRRDLNRGVGKLGQYMYHTGSFGF